MQAFFWWGRGLRKRKNLHIANARRFRDKIAGGIAKRFVETKRHKTPSLGKRVLPSQLERSSFSGKRALRRLLVTSTVSGKRLLESEAISSVGGAHCVPSEAILCAWGGNACHPDDIRECDLTGLRIHVSFATVGPRSCLKALDGLLGGRQQTAERTDLWELMAFRLNAAVKGKIRTTSAATSPTGKRLAVVADARVFFGIRVTAVGFVYDIDQSSIVGAIANGRRTARGWERQSERTLPIAS